MRPSRMPVRRSGPWKISAGSFEKAMSGCRVLTAAALPLISQPALALSHVEC